MMPHNEFLKDFFKSVRKRVSNYSIRLKSKGRIHL